MARFQSLRLGLRGFSPGPRQGLNLEAGVGLKVDIKFWLLSNTKSVSLSQISELKLQHKPNARLKPQPSPQSLSLKPSLNLTLTLSLRPSLRPSSRRCLCTGRTFRVIPHLSPGQCPGPDSSFRAHEAQTLDLVLLSFGNGFGLGISLGCCLSWLVALEST